MHKLYLRDKRVGILNLLLNHVCAPGAVWSCTNYTVVHIRTIQACTAQRPGLVRNHSHASPKDVHIPPPTLPPLHSPTHTYIPPPPPPPLCYPPTPSLYLSTLTLPSYPAYTPINSSLPYPPPLIQITPREIARCFVCSWAAQLDHSVLNTQLLGNVAYDLHPTFVQDV